MTDSHKHYSVNFFCQYYKCRGPIWIATTGVSCGLKHFAPHGSDVDIVFSLAFIALASNKKKIKWNVYGLDYQCSLIHFQNPD